MKYQFFTFLLLFFTFTKSYGFSCVAGKETMGSFKAQVGPSSMRITFDKSQGKDWKDLAGKTLVLSLDPGRGNSEWKYNVGKVEVDKDFQEFIHIEIGYRVSSLKQGKLVGNFALSPRSSKDWPIYLDMIAMSCQ